MAENTTSPTYSIPPSMLTCLRANIRKRPSARSSNGTTLLSRHITTACELILRLAPQASDLGKKILELERLMGTQSHRVAQRRMDESFMELLLLVENLFHMYPLLEMAISSSQDRDYLQSLLKSMVARDQMPPPTSPPPPLFPMPPQTEQCPPKTP
jgi:hypothetical protein